MTTLEKRAVEARQLLASGARCVTLTGPPGVGKTTLLDAILASPHGTPVLRFDAQSAQSFDSLQESIRVGLGAGATTSLAAALDSRPLLLVIDHVEAMLDELSQRLPTWLQASELQVVFGSRRRLDVSGEQLIVVEPLTDDEGLRLFDRRIAELGVMPIDETKARSLLSLLGGLPLAIELAAARCRMVPIDVLVARCEESSDVLGAAVESSIERSVDLLDKESAKLLKVLSMFENPVSIRSVESVWDGNPWDQVQTLMDSSLARLTTAGALELLPPIRRHVYDRLDGAEIDALSARHREWADRETIAALGLLRGERWREGYDVLGALRAEIEGALSRWAGSTALRAKLVSHLDDIRPYFGASSDLASKMEQLLPELKDEALGEMALRRARLAYIHGDLDGAQSFHRRAVEGAPALKDSPTARCILFEIRVSRGDGSVLDELDAAAEDAASTGDRESEARFRIMFIELSRMFGRGEDARRHGERALLLTAHGIPSDRAPILAGLGFAQSETGKPEAAAEYAEEGLAALDEVSSSPSRTRSALLIIRGRAAHLAKDYSKCREAYRAAASGPDPFMSASASAVIATLHIEKGEFVDARDRLRVDARVVAQHQPVYGAVFTALLAALEARLGQVERGRARFDDIPSGPMPLFATEIMQLCDDTIRHAEGHDVEAPAECVPHAMWIEHRAARSILQSQRSGEDVGGLRVKELRIEQNAQWFMANGERTNLTRRPVMRRVLRAFVEHRTLRHDELLAFGWGEEKMLERSARRRLEVMVSRLRALGIGDAIETIEGGYRVHRDCEVTIVIDEAATP